MLRMLKAAADLMLFPNSSHSYIKRMACLCKTGTFIIQVTRNIQSRSMFGNPTVRDLHIYIYFFFKVIQHHHWWAPGLEGDLFVDRQKQGFEFILELGALKSGRFH